MGNHERKRAIDVAETLAWAERELARQDAQLSESLEVAGVDRALFGAAFVRRARTGVVVRARVALGMRA